MSWLMALQASTLLARYGISGYPIPIHIIEHIITSEQYDIQPIKNFMTRAVVIGNTVIIGNVTRATYREYLAHELCHIKYHDGNQALKNPWQVRKEEHQAQSFSAYFLMPDGMFEEAMKVCEDDYYLSREFGVTVDLVRFRKKYFAKEKR